VFRVPASPTMPTAATPSVAASPTAPPVVQAPSAPTVAQPTAPSTSMPTSVFRVGAGPFTGPSGSSFGNSAAMNDQVAAVGAPQRNRLGSVTTFLMENGLWSAAVEVFGVQTDSMFGWSVDVSGLSMIVGATNAFVSSTGSRTGEAYVYQYQPDVREWRQLGSPMTGQAAGDEFGYSVAVSDPLRLVIGAPKRSGGAGAVYTYEWRAAAGGTFDWLLTTSMPTTISDGGEFGQAVAISKDGSKLLAGAPEANGGNGKIVLYEYDTFRSEWAALFKLDGSSGDKLGKTVTFLNSNGSMFAVGSPGFDPSGRVDTSQQITDSSNFARLEPSIVGTSGEIIGASISGAVKNGAPCVFVGTNNGQVKRFDYVSRAWQMTSTVGTGSSNKVTGLASGNATDFFVAGMASSDLALIYAY
jgi:hypothetical protein